MLLGLLSERRFCRRCAGKPRLPVLIPLFRPRTRFLVKSRTACVVKFAVLLRPISRSIVLMSAPVGLLTFVSRRVHPRFRRRQTLGSICQRLDADVVFLVGTPDFDGERLCDRFGNFELGGCFQNADGTDVMLVDTATTANHRQQPARLRVFLPSDGGAKPHAAVRHAVTRRCSCRLRSWRGRAIVAARRPAVFFPTADVAGSASALAGVENVLGRGKPRPIQPRQRRGNILGDTAAPAPWQYPRATVRRAAPAPESDHRWWSPPRTAHRAACAPDRACEFHPPSARCPRRRRCLPDSAAIPRAAFAWRAPAGR